LRRYGGAKIETNMIVDVLIIGAGPSGALAAALLCRRGVQVLVLEREQFPRFSIGESLLPQSMEYLDQAGMLGAVERGGFQVKNGAAFGRGQQYTEFDFSDKFSDGWNYTYQVPRARFDHLLALEAERQGAEIRFRHEVVAVDLSATRPRVTTRDEQGDLSMIETGFILDASGFGRVLPRLLGLERPSDFPVRGALFTHVEDQIPPSAFDRNKIRIDVQPDDHDLWYWLIPFSDGRCSIGVVGGLEALARYQGTTLERLRALVEADAALNRLLGQAQWDTPVRQLLGYASNVSSLWGRGYALLGNAGEFLDPIFSSGVTIAFKSASLAAALVPNQLAGAAVDWEREFALPLKQGVDTFRAFVESWYRGGLQRIIFDPVPRADIRRMIAAILAGYVWDRSNPYASQTRRRLAALEELCYQG
jgi:flavin-dependent dehydrogenase